MKIIYLFERRLSYKGDDVRFGYNVFLQHGYEVEVWSLAEWTFGCSNNDGDLSGGAQDDSNKFLKYIKNKEEFLRNLSRISTEKCFFICYPYHGYGEVSAYIRSNLHKRKLSFANVTESPSFCGAGIKPISMNLMWVIVILIRNFFVRNIYYIFRWLVSFGNDKNSFKSVIDSFHAFIGFLLYPSVYNFVTTKWMYYSFPNPLEKWCNRNVLICANSYDEYLQSKDTKRVMSGKYIVFIDQGLLSRDNMLIAQGFGLPVTKKEEYCKELNILFARLEKEYDCQVVIALHPKANYVRNEFGNRKMFSNKTPQLIRDAELVINHFSMSFGLAAMYKKDILEIYTDEMLINNRGIYRRYYGAYEEMGCRLLNISDATQVDLVKEYIFSYDEKKYSDYLDAAVKSKGSIGEGKTFYQCVYEYIDKWRIEKGWSIKE